MSQSLLRFAPVLISAALIAGCTSADPRSVLGSGGADQKPPVDAATGSAVVQGACPAVILREGTAYYTTYVKGGDGDPAKAIRPGNAASMAIR